MYRSGTVYFTRGLRLNSITCRNPSYVSSQSRDFPVCDHFAKWFFSVDRCEATVNIYLINISECLFGISAGTPNTNGCGCCVIRFMKTKTKQYMPRIFRTLDFLRAIVRSHHVTDITRSNKATNFLDLFLSLVPTNFIKINTVHSIINNNTDENSALNHKSHAKFQVFIS